jgi:hypothetical protein
MKSLKTYNMDHDVINILRRIPNKSQYVCQSVRLMSNSEYEYELDLVNSRIVLINLKHRDDISDALKALIDIELSRKTNS